MTETVEPGEAERAHARRVAEAKATIPHTYLEVVAAGAGEAGEGELVAAVGHALAGSPRVNGAYRDGRYELRSQVNVAVAIDADGTVVHPVVRDADSKDAEEIARELEGLAERAASGSLTRPDLSGATFSIADLRPQGVARAQGAIRRGQAAYLSVGEPGPGQLSLCLACDGRILRGPEAAEFLGRVRGRLEDA